MKITSIHLQNKDAVHIICVVENTICFVVKHDSMLLKFKGTKLFSVETNVKYDLSSLLFNSEKHELPNTQVYEGHSKTMSHVQAATAMSVEERNSHQDCPVIHLSPISFEREVIKQCIVYCNMSVFENILCTEGTFPCYQVQSFNQGNVYTVIYNL